MRNARMYLELTITVALPFRRLFFHSHLVAFSACCSCGELYRRQPFVGVVVRIRRGGCCVGIHCSVLELKTNAL